MSTDVGLEKVTRTNNAMALTGFILGVVSIGFYMVGALPMLAVIFSCVGLGTFKADSQKNWWMAPVGLLLGLAYTATYLRAYGHI